MRHNYKIFNFTKWNASSLFKIRCLLHFGILSTWTDYLPTYLTWTIVDIWLTTYLPHLVHVVCEWPLSERDRGFWITVLSLLTMYVLYFLPIFVVYLKMSVCLGYPCILTSSFLHSFLFFHNSHIISNKLFDVVISKWRRSEQSFSVENDKIKTSLDLNPALVNWCQSKRLKTAASRAQGAAVECFAMFWLLINWEKKIKNTLWHHSTARLNFAKKQNINKTIDTPAKKSDSTKAGINQNICNSYSQ